MSPRDEAWDNAEFPAPVPADLPPPPAPAATPAPAPSANQLMLRIRAGMEQLEWIVPHHDGPWSPTLETRELMAAHMLTIVKALSALVALPIRTPAPIEEPANVEA